MSRIGKSPISIPSGVSVAVSGHVVTVTGPKGSLTMGKRSEIDVRIEDSTVYTSIARDTKQSNAFWGLTSALISNMIQGVSQGYEKKLSLEGVGYRVKAEGKGLSLSLGFSHPVIFMPPEGIELVVEDNKTIVVRGMDKQLVGLTAANIRKIRKPEPYKGKGIRYFDEVVRRKPGKSGKV